MGSVEKDRAYKREWSLRHRRRLGIQAPGVGQCGLCGSVYERSVHNQQFCEPCRPEARRQAKNRRNVRAYDKKRQPIICAICEKVIRRQASRQKVCDDCRKVWKAAQDQVWARQNIANVKAIRKRSYVKRAAEPKHRLSRSISPAIRRSIISKYGGRWQALVGYTLSDLMRHLERQFTDGMSWENYGSSGWHIDHIRPQTSFQFETANDPEFRACWALTNLRPLWASENLRKQARVTLLL